MDFVTRADAARIFGVHRSRLTQLVQAGRLPLHDGKVDLGQVAELLKPREKSPGRDESEYWVIKGRLEKAKAEMAEMDLKEKKKQLVRVEYVTRSLEKMFDAFRQKTLAIGRQLASTLAGLNDPSEINEEIQKVVCKTLEELSGYDPVTGGFARLNFVS